MKQAVIVSAARTAIGTFGGGQGIAMVVEQLYALSSNQRLRNFLVPI